MNHVATSTNECQANDFANRRPKLLCIDDDPEITRSIELRLQESEVDVIRAFHGMHGFWSAMTEQPDLIITDLNMPQGQGDYIVECLKRNSETHDIPIFVLTGIRDKAVKQKMKNLGVKRYFTKPWQFGNSVGGNPPAARSDAANTLTRARKQARWQMK